MKFRLSLAKKILCLLRVTAETISATSMVIEKITLNYFLEHSYGSKNLMLLNLQFTNI